MGTINLNCDNKILIPTGYYSDNHSININTLAAQTSATAGAGDIVKGKTAWVNGKKLTGTFSGVNTGYATISRHVIFNYAEFLYDTKNMSISTYSGTTVPCNANTNRFLIILAHLIREYDPGNIYYTGPKWSQGFVDDPYIGIVNFSTNFNVPLTKVHSVWSNIDLQCIINVKATKGGNITTTATCKSLLEGAWEYYYNMRECYMELWQLR